MRKRGTTMSNTLLTLIRHGESFANVEPIVESYTCRGLTPKGITQAHALAQRITTEQWQYDVLYASTLKRAQMTAQIIGPALNLPITGEDGLHELRVGEIDGMNYRDVSQQYPAFDNAINDVHTKVAPAGESWNEFALRCATTLHAIATRHAGQRIAVVCHGGVIECAFLWACDLNAGVRRRVAFPARNTALTTWHHRVSPFDHRLEWQLLCHNDHAHLLSM